MGDWDDVRGAERPVPGDEVDDMTLEELEEYIAEHPEMFVSEEELNAMFGDLLADFPNVMVPLAGRAEPLREEDLLGVKERIWKRLMESDQMRENPDAN